MKKAVFRLILLLLLVAAGYGIYRTVKGLPGRQEQTPTTRVRKGDVVVRSFTRGELRAVRTATLTAPNLFGTVQVTKLAPLGALAKDKDLIVEFDDSEVESRLEQRQLELEQVNEQIKKAEADLAIRNNQDQVDLLKARYTVRRAELEVKRNELLSTIDQKKNQLNLEEARRRLQQLESDIKSKQAQAQAELAVLREKRNRNNLDINRERMRLAQVKLLAPISGLVAIKQNRSGFSGMFGTQVPDIREGDQVPPGTPVADVLDLSELEVIARVGELDRANLKEGQEVLIRLDAIPDKVFNGKIKSMSGTASANIFSSDPGKKFDVIFSIDMKQLLSALGAKPDQIAKILATADENRKKPIASASTSMFAMMGGGNAGFGGGAPGGFQAGGAQAGGMAAGGMQAGGFGAAAPGGMQAGGAGGGGTRVMMGGPMMGGADMTEEQQKKAREIFQKLTAGKNMMELSQDERRELFTKMRAEMEKAGLPSSQRRGGDTKAGDTKAGDTKAGDTKAGGATAAAPAGQAGASGEGGRQRLAMGGQGGPGGMPMPTMGGNGQFSAKDLENAKLPPAPEESSQLDVLLRPGLLADVEIIVDKVPDAIHVPNQSVFEQDGKPVVYVKVGGKFEARPITIAKRSESLTVIAGGVKPGDVISLSDPTAKPGDAKKKGAAKKEGSGAGGAMGAMPGGASKGGQ